MVYPSCYLLPGLQKRSVDWEESRRRRKGLRTEVRLWEAGGDALELPPGLEGTVFLDVGSPDRMIGSMKHCFLFIIPKSQYSKLIVIK